MLRRASMRSAVRALIAAAALSGGAAAQTSAAPTAEELFKVGREAMRSGDLRAACESFAASQRLAPARGTLLNLAICEERSSRLLAAKVHLEELLSIADLDEERRAMAREHLNTVLRLLPRLVLRFDPDAARAYRFHLDGRPLPSPLPADSIALDPGAHVVDVASPDGPVHAIPLVLDPGTETVLTELPRPAPSPAPERRAPVAAQPAEHATKLPPRPGLIPYVVGAVGLAGLATSAVTGLMVIDRKHTVEAHCERKVCDPEGLAAGESGRTLSLVATASFGVGAGLTAVAAYLLLVGGEDPPAPAVTVSVGTGSARATLAGEF